MLTTAQMPMVGVNSGEKFVLRARTIITWLCARIGWSGVGQKR